MEQKTDRPALGFISALGVLCAAQFVLQLDFSIVNVALPTIQRELGFAASNLQWVVTGYALTFGSLLLLGGRAGDSLGRRRLLLLGLALFALASLTCGFAVTPLMLIVSRVVQGTGAAFVSPSALALLTSTNAEGPARNRALSLPTGGSLAARIKTRGASATSGTARVHGEPETSQMVVTGPIPATRGATAKSSPAVRTAAPGA